HGPHLPCATDTNIASDVHQAGQPFPHCSRSVLRRQVEAAARAGYRFQAGMECEVPDISCNPYLAIAMHIAAALEGIEQQLDPGEPCREDTFQLGAEERTARGYGTLPRTLLEATEALASDTLGRDVLGPELHRDYVAAKLAE